MAESIQTYITIEKYESDCEEQDDSNHDHFVRRVEVWHHRCSWNIGTRMTHYQKKGPFLFGLQSPYVSYIKMLLTSLGDAKWFCMFAV